MTTRVRISDESLNCYKTRILTDGLDIAQYQRNPVLLYMHFRGKVIGYIKDVKKENGEVTGELVFDEASEESVRAKKQFEFGSLKMVSAGIDIIEMSEDLALLVPGQTRPTITRSRLVEVSVVDIGGNDNALVLSRDGIRLEMGKDGENPLPELKGTTNTTIDIMELKTLALMLGLPETATEKQVTAKIKQLLALNEELTTLRAEKEMLNLSLITAAVEAGVREKRIAAGDKEHFIGLGKKLGLDELKATIGKIPAQTKLSQVINHAGDGVRSYARLGEVPASEIATLRKEDRAEYLRLFEAEYGYKPEMED